MPGREKEKYDKSKIEGKDIIWVMGKFIMFLIKLSHCRYYLNIGRLKYTFKK